MIGHCLAGSALYWQSLLAHLYSRPHGSVWHSHSQAGRVLSVRSCAALPRITSRSSHCNILIVALCVKKKGKKVKKKVSLCLAAMYHHGHFTCLPAGTSGKLINGQTAHLRLQPLTHCVDGALGAEDHVSLLASS